MLDWQIGRHRTTDPNWEADWHQGIAIGLLIIVGLALVVAIGSLQLSSAEMPAGLRLSPI